MKQRRKRELKPRAKPERRVGAEEGGDAERDAEGGDRAYGEARVLLTNP